VPEHPDIEGALNGDPIKVQRQRVGHHLLAADHSAGYGATFSFYWTESGSWESDTSLYERSVGPDESTASGWRHLVSAGADGERWEWVRLEERDSWTDHVLLVIGVTAREDELEDGREVLVRAISGFAAPRVMRLVCESDGATHEVAVNEPWRSFVALGVTMREAIGLVAHDADGVVLQHTTYDV
jgi:hypothetical protein